MAGIADFIVNDNPVEGYGVNVSGDNFSDDIHAESSDYGAIVFSKDFRIGKNLTKTLILYFPNTWHTNTHGRTSATNAEIAGRNIIEGKWHDWWTRTISAIVWDAEKELSRKVDFLYSKEMRKSRNEWNRITHTKDYQKLWKAYKARIDKLKRQHASAKRISEERAPDFWSLVPDAGMSLLKQTEWVRTQKEAFLARRRRAVSQRAELWRKIQSLSSKANVHRYKSGLVSQFRTQEWIDKIEALDAEIRNLEASETVFQRRKSLGLQDRMRMLVDPWSFGFNAEKALKEAGKSIVLDMKDALHGAKAPDLAPRTKLNRRYRGNPETPALDETGEFIESLSFDII